MFQYECFGLSVCSEFRLMFLQRTGRNKPDVLIRRGQTDHPDGFMMGAGKIHLRIPPNTWICVSEGKEIIADVPEDMTDSLLSLYLLGSCMGAILWQRGGMLLHGSCVAKDGKGLLITGASGAGKSTLAREFLRSGWQLVTDDVASIAEKDGVYYVQSSYPSQKLWQDAMNRYDLSGEPLFQEDRRDKFHVDASASFREGLTPLHMVLRLAAGDETELRPVTGIAQVDQLMKNTYRPYMIPPEERERHFQRCVALADEVPMMLGVRKKEENGARLLREKIEEVFA